MASRGVTIDEVDNGLIVQFFLADERGPKVMGKLSFEGEGPGTWTRASGVIATYLYSQPQVTETTPANEKGGPS